MDCKNYLDWLRDPDAFESIADGMHPHVKIQIYYGMMKECDYLRQKEYPDLGEQLDMLYHDQDEWKESITRVKKKYPRPPHTELDFDDCEDCSV